MFALAIALIIVAITWLVLRHDGQKSKRVCAVMLEALREAFPKPIQSAMLRRQVQARFGDPVSVERFYVCVDRLLENGLIIQITGNSTQEPGWRETVHFRLAGQAQERSRIVTRGSNSTAAMVNETA